nr:hypothetical protein [Nitrosomonas nitrosa]
MDAYRSDQWRQFRNEVIRLDGEECLSCGRNALDGVVLQVHHKTYHPGKKPWEYGFAECETMCTGCHAARHGKIPPKFGWEFAGWEDLENLSGTCDCCGAAIRYVFCVSHESWGVMEVGEICCDNLTCTQVASGVLESQRRYATRLKTFVSSSRWRKDWRGGVVIRQKHMEIRITQEAGKFRILAEGVRGGKLFDDLIEAKIAAFAAVESGKMQDYVRKYNQRCVAQGWYT